MQEEIEAMIEEIDADGSGDIDFDEFVAVMSRKVETKYTAEEVKAAFKVFEGAAPKDHIRVVDLVDSLMRYGDKKLTKEQAQELISQLEPDGNGLVNYADFVNMMLTK
ncbi:unnamed protein product [Symbiodinium sp. KB8]|nr:unnamed protein product [Symbiodinium sp. KB8]